MVDGIPFGITDAVSKVVYDACLHLYRFPHAITVRQASRNSSGSTPPSTSEDPNYLAPGYGTMMSATVRVAAQGIRN
jgi:hypothetical protein